MSVIYFIQSGAEGPIKIGVTRCLHRRVAILQTGNPEPLRLLATHEGGEADERAIHDVVAKDRVRGEWFRPTPTVLAEVAKSTPYVEPVKRPSLNKILIAEGISPSYASMIANNVQRPSRPLAIHIFRKTGWRHDLIADLTDEQIETLEAVEPWSPRPSDTSVAA